MVKTPGESKKTSVCLPNYHFLSKILNRCQRVHLYVCVCMLNHFRRVWLFATVWNVAHQVPLSMEFPRQEYWSGLPFPSPEDLPYPGIKPMSPALAGGFSTTEPPRKPTYLHTYRLNTYCKNHFIDPCFNFISYYSFPKILKSTLASVKFLQKST